MKHIFTTAIVLLLLCAQAQPGILSDRLDFSASARGIKMTGHTTYRINFSELYLFQGFSVLANSSSELEFPLDAYMTEFTFSLSGRVIRDLPWSLVVSLGTNADDPGGAMKDSDWLQVPQAQFDEKIIYSESGAALDAGTFDISAQAAVWRTTRTRFDVMLGYRYQKLEFEAIGLDGWYLDEDFNQVPFSDHPGEVVLTYEVEYKIPYAGIASEFDIIRKVRGAATIKGSPLVSSSDYNDHILRNKCGESDGTGGMVSFDGRVSFTIDELTRGLGLAVGLGYEYTYINTSGTQTQSWYGDDLSSPFDDTGTEYTGIRDKLKSSQRAIYLTVSGMF
jgi:hypothetical protein